MIERKSPLLLVIDDEKAICDVLAASLRDDGYEVITAETGEDGLALIHKMAPEIVLLDIWMPGNLDGLEVLRRANEAKVSSQFIMMSGHGTIETAVKAVKLGAFDFVEKPLSIEKVSILIQNILNLQNEKKEKILLLNKLRRNLALMGVSDVMKALKSTVASTARESLPVLVMGEPGSGRSLIAQNIHYLGPRAAKAWSEVQCGMIPEELQIQELFGVEKGVNPGADASRRGRIELTKEGTLCLDDVTKLCLPAQARLLQFLRTGRVTKEGAEVSTPVSVRLIAIADPNIVGDVREGRFLPELYQQLSLAQIRAPNLRDHIEDLTIFLKHFGEQFVRDGSWGLKTFTDEAIQALATYPWPGNVRELRNFVERLYILISDEQIDIEDLRFAGLVEKTGGSQQLLTFREARAEFEKEFLLRKIAENQGNISKTAEVIGLERSYLHRKIKAYGIEV